MNLQRNVKHFSSKIVKLDINSILSNNSIKNVNTNANNISHASNSNKSNNIISPCKQNLMHYYPVSNKYFDEMLSNNETIDTDICSKVK